MGLKKLVTKIADYNERLEQGRASKIQPDHVRRTLTKLRKIEDALTEEIGSATNNEKRSRLERKLKIAREHITRAEWLLGQISEDASN